MGMGTEGWNERIEKSFTSGIKPKFFHLIRLLHDSHGFSYKETKKRLILAV